MRNSLYDHELDALPPLDGTAPPLEAKKASGQGKTPPPQVPGNQVARFLRKWLPASSGHEVLAGVILIGIVVQHAVRPTWGDVVVLAGLPFAAALLWRLKIPASPVRAYRVSTAVAVLCFDLAVFGAAFHIKTMAHNNIFMPPADLTALLLLPLVRSLGWREGWREGVTFPLLACVWNIPLVACFGIAHYMLGENATDTGQPISVLLTLMMVILAAMALIPFFAYNSLLEFKDKRHASLRPGRSDACLAAKG